MDVIVEAVGTEIVIAAKVVLGDCGELLWSHQLQEEGDPPSFVMDR